MTAIFEVEIKRNAINLDGSLLIFLHIHPAFWDDARCTKTLMPLVLFFQQLIHYFVLYLFYSMVLRMKFLIVAY